MFYWNSLAFSMTQQILAIWSLVPLLFPKPAWTSGTSQFKDCRSLAWRILSITLLACEMSAIVWYFEHSLALPFFGIGMKTDLFQSCGHCCIFQICWHIECSIFIASSFRIWNSYWIERTWIENHILFSKICCFPGRTSVKNLPANAGDVRVAGSILGFRRSPGGGHGNPLWYSCLGNPWTEDPGRL